MLREQERYLETELPVRSLIGTYNVVKSLDLRIDWLIADSEHAAEPAPKRNGPLLARGRQPICRDDG
jgi:hypothetical protein